MLISIAAIGKNNELGKNNDLIWHLPTDLRFFKEMTMGKKMIMGRKTYESFKTPLKGRTHVVITSTPIESNYDNVIFTNDMEGLVTQYENSDDEIYVIGGASIYKAFLEHVKKMYLTEVEAIDAYADAFYPTFDKNEWEQKEIGNNQDNGISYKHVMYTRKK